MSISSMVCNPMAPANNEEVGNSPERVDLVMMMMPDDLEHLNDYDTGGLHPVHLGDSLGPEGRYRVLHKLGNGGFATVWLCRDTQAVHPQYVALKILMAECSTTDCPEFLAFKMNESLNFDSERKQNICLPRSHFRIDGPNGSHLCFVYSVVGPSIWHKFRKFGDRKAFARCVALQVTRALASLHEFDVCHGDLTPSNVLLHAIGLDELPEDELIKVLGEPRRAPVTTLSGHEHHEPRAPQYLVYPTNFDNLGVDALSGDASIIDFGQSFEAANPPEATGIPVVYRAPELIFNYKPGKSSDLWALGCTLSEIRNGCRLFDMYDDNTDEYLITIALRLGKLPEHLWSKWERRNVALQEEADELGRVILKHEKPTSDDPTAWSSPEPRSLKEAIIGRRPPMYREDESQSASKVSRDLFDEEADLFADLLEKLMSLEPENRLSAKEASEHDWFRFSEIEQQATIKVAEQTSELMQPFMIRVEQNTITQQGIGGGEQSANAELRQLKVEAQDTDVEVQNASQPEHDAIQAAPGTGSGEQETSEKENRRPRRHSI